MKRLHLVVALLFFWAGFVCSISFMEAWVKFQAPGVTLSIGVGIGQLVFVTLNRVEWVLATLIVLLGWRTDILKRNVLFGFIVAIVCLLLQTFVLLPILDERATQIMQGKILPPTLTHLFFVLIEMCKVVAIFFSGIKALQETKKYTAGQTT